MTCERTVIGEGVPPQNVAGRPKILGARVRYFGHCEIRRKLFYLGLTRDEYGPTAAGMIPLKLIFMWRPRPEDKPRHALVPCQFGLTVKFWFWPYRYGPGDRWRWVSFKRR